MKKIPDPNQLKPIRGPKLGPKDQKISKVRITTYLDEDVLEILRQMALESGAKYQAVLNQILRAGLLGEQRGLFARVSHLERVVFKKGKEGKRVA